jgi:hypothetical protein
MQLNYGHIKEDLEAGITPVAVRLEPRFYVGKKAAGYTFLGDGSIRLIRECLNKHLIEGSFESKLIPRSYYSVRTAIHRANRILGLDPKIQTCHGLRKYYENALDDANVDHEKKMVLEGHFAGTRARHYTDRNIEQLREVYKRSYPFIEVGPATHTPDKVGQTEWHSRLASVETQMARQVVLEAKLVVLQDELSRLTRMIEKSDGI